jgi:hypothetical protein
VGITKFRMKDFEAMVTRVERRMLSTSIFITQVGKLEIVKSALSSLSIYILHDYFKSD